MIKVGILKCGNIALSTVIDLLLDERGNRENVQMRVIGTGAKMGEGEAEFLARNASALFEPDLVLYLSPNLSSAGPRKALGLLSKKTVPTIVISDGPRKPAVPDGLGYLIVPADPMMGVRREFLDPAEMMLFNADALKVLAGTGAARMVQDAIDAVIQAIDRGSAVPLPRLTIQREDAIAHAKYHNPYARSKAMAAFDMAVRAGEMNFEGCFEKEKMEDYIPLVAAAHEMLRCAAQLIDEAREIEKCSDSVARFPHRKSGETLEKSRLMEKPLK